MKKKLLSIIVSICFILPCAIMLAACGVNPHTHEYDEAWTKNETHHWHKCKGCDEIKEKAEHNWDDGEIATPSSPTTDGVKTYTCEDCEATKTEPVEYLPRTTVTEEEFNTVQTSINNLQFEEFKAIMQTNDETQNTVIVDGKKIYVNSINNGEYYLQKLSDIFYMYSNNGSGWEIDDIDESTYIEKTFLFDLELVYSNFTYNSSEL